MPQQLNTKFIVVVVAFIVVAVGSVGLFWGYRVMTDPVKNIERGRELEAAGNYAEAVRAYGRAVSKRRTNIEYLDLMRNALLKVVPPTAEEARQHYQMNLDLLQQRAAVEPSKLDPWLPLLDAQRDRAHFLQNPAAWRALADTATRMRESMPAGSEGERIALRELGVASVQRDAQLTDSERREVEAMLRKVLSADSKDERAWDALMLLLLSDANRQFLANQRLQGTERQREFEQALAEATAAVPDSAAVALARIRLLRSLVARGELDVIDAVPQLDEPLTALEAVSSGPAVDRWQVSTAVNELLSTNRRADAERATALVELALSRNPNDLVLKRLLAIALRQYDLDRAVSVSRGLIDSPTPPVSLESAFRDEIRSDAAERVFDIEIAKARVAEDETIRRGHIQNAEKMRDLLVELTRGGPADNPRLLKSEAKLALLAGDLVTASARLDRIIRQDAADAEVFLLAADAAARRNELGLALNRINQGIERAGPTYAFLLAKAKVELGLRRAAEAMRTAEQILAARPDDVEAMEVRDAARRITQAASPGGSADPIVRDLQESERLLSERKTDDATVIVNRLLTAHPTDARVLTQAARLKMMNEEIEAAVQLLDRALAQAPNDPFIIQLRSVAGTTDPVDRINNMVQLSVADERQRPMAKYSMLMGVIAAVRREIAAGGRTADGRIRDIDELNASLARLESVLPEFRQAALAAGTTGPAFFTAAFDDAVVAADFKRAEQVGVEAEKAGERALGIFLQARALGLQGRGAEGIALLERNRQQGINSVEMARQLGELREAAGQVPEAIAALTEAYERRPGDPSTLRTLAELLRRTGENTRALQLYRDAAQLPFADRSVVQTWLRLEDQFGDRSTALCWRRRIFAESPGDRENALSLAVLLTDGQGDYRLLVDAQCRPRFTDSEWVSLAPARRQQEIQTMIRANQAEGAEVFRRLLLQRNDDFEAALLHARAMARDGRVNDGEKLLREVLARAEVSQTGPMWIGLGQYLDGVGRTDQALEAFERARQLQDPKRREADATISDYWFNQSQWERAYTALGLVLEGQASPDPRLLRRQAEIALKLRRFDEADALVERSVASGGAESRDVVVELLTANIANGRAEDLWTAGDKAGAEAAFSKSEAALRRAIQLQPGSALPVLSLASLQKSRAIRTGNQSELNAAQASAERGVAMASAFWPGVRLLHEILLEKGDLTGATAAVERFLPTDMGNVEARRALADLYLRAGNIQRALAVLADGATRTPSDPVWPIAIGEIQSRRGLHAEAVAAFDRALELSPGPQLLTRAVEARQRSSPPDWRGIVALGRQYSNEFRASGTLRAALGASLVNTGDRDSGLQTLRETGRFIRAEIAAQRMRMAELDAWYAALRQVFPAPRTQELDAFVRETFANDLQADDLRWLAAMWTETGPSGIVKAEEYLVQAIAAAEASQDALYRSRVWLAAGNVAYLKDDCNEAIRYFEKVAEEDPTNVTALNNLGYLLAKCQNETKRALGYARRAVAASPSQPEFLDTLGFVLLKEGEYSEARTMLERAVRIRPNAGTFVKLAEAFKALGRTNDAVGALDQAAALNPTPETRAAIDELRRSM
ncbi:MAG: tetratricopeptide repeat protein [Phycisphaeraceae bacterium]|nr:tetratricopeptide repeat protein [Phycisphaeraceae bacterium]